MIAPAASAPGSTSPGGQSASGGGARYRQPLETPLDADALAALAETAALQRVLDLLRRELDAA